MFSKMFILKCITNLHVGNGDENYNIVDQEVEKDPVTGYPMINSSGVKGALKAYFSRNNYPKKDIETWFGSDHESTISQQGLLNIEDALMMAIPMRASKGNKAYYLVSTEDAIEKYNSLAEDFGLTTRIKDTDEQVSDIEVEGYIVPKKVNDHDIYIISSRDMNLHSLPVNARNKLNNGISENLWYEEYVPHESIFYFLINTNDKKLLDDFETEVKDKVIQFGGHASIGYGFCKISVEA